MRVVRDWAGHLRCLKDLVLWNLELRNRSTSMMLSFENQFWSLIGAQVC